jgi:hypothetical protein
MARESLIDKRAIMRDALRKSLMTFISKVKPSPRNAFLFPCKFERLAAHRNLGQAKLSLILCPTLRDNLSTQILAKDDNEYDPYAAYSARQAIFGGGSP